MSINKLKGTEIEIETAIHEMVEGYDNEGHIFITDYNNESRAKRIDFIASVENLDTLIRQLTDLRKEVAISNSNSLHFITDKKDKV